MVILKPSAEVVTKIDYVNAVKTVESLEKIKTNQKVFVRHEDSEEFVRDIIKSGKISCLESISLSLRIIVDKEMAYNLEQGKAIKNKEILRNFIQEEQRFKDEIIVINPGYEKGTMEYDVWRDSCADSESAYRHLIDNGMKSDLAKRVLPICMKTELIITMNIEEWRTFIMLHLENKGFPQTKKVIRMILTLLKEQYKVFFEDIDKGGI